MDFFLISNAYIRPRSGFVFHSLLLLKGRKWEWANISKINDKKIISVNNITFRDSLFHWLSSQVWIVENVHCLGAYFALKQYVNEIYHYW